MTPSPDNALRTLMMTLMMEVGPQIASDYLKSSVGIIAATQMFIAEEFDRAADVTAWENREMRQLFRDHAAAVADDDLAAEMRAAAESLDADLRVSTLTAGNVQLRRLLIRAHAALEELDTDAAREAERQLWALLVESSQRRALGF